MITSVLVANRGEIALRVFRTCRDLGISTVAVFSDADADAMYVRAADRAVHLPGNAATDTYLRADLIIDAARKAGADAIHPGYGFLSENAAFARAVTEAGLTWIGPPPEAIEVMGDKIASKRLMAQAGVPVLAELDPDQVTASELPIMVKASAGGGGRGIRIVGDLGDLLRQVEEARAEAQSAFGDPTVFCERYLPAGRHIEVQVLCDTRGTVWAVGERECSIQRRHQKVVEETPSPLVERTPGMRERLLGAARMAAAAIDYTGAGTVEFLADDRPGHAGEFYFLEMNTRLQVEHPVTECVTGLDLVEQQIRVADGRALPASPPPSRGHAIEARLYAEDPALDWRPQTGTLHTFAVPGVVTSFATIERSAGIRLDSGVTHGSTISPYYDPMLAKVIAWGPERDHAARLLADALTRATIHGPRTNRDLLVGILTHPAFRSGDTTTAFLDRHGLDQLAAPLLDGDTERLAALAAALAEDARHADIARVHGDLPSGWRNVPSRPQCSELVGDRGVHRIRFRFERGRLLVEDRPDLRLVSATPARVVLRDGGLQQAFAVARHGDELYVDTTAGSVRYTVRDPLPDPTHEAAPGSLVAPLPGSVVRLDVSEGDNVRSGQTIILLEAMKMQHPITAPVDGTVAKLLVSQGDQVDNGTVLAVIDSAASA